MNLSSRLNAVQRERSRRCSSCGGPMVLASPRGARDTFDALVQAYQALSDAEKVEMAVARGRAHLLPPRLREMASRVVAAATPPGT